MKYAIEIDKAGTNEKVSASGLMSKEELLKSLEVLTEPFMYGTGEFTFTVHIVNAK